MKMINSKILLILVCVMTLSLLLFQSDTLSQTTSWEFYFTTTSSLDTRSLQFTIPNNSSIYKTEVWIDIDPTPSSFSMKVNGGTDVTLMNNAWVDVYRPGMSGSIRKRVRLTTSPPEYTDAEFRIRILHDQDLISSIETWTLTIHGFSTSSETHVKLFALTCKDIGDNLISGSSLVSSQCPNPVIVVSPDPHNYGNVPISSYEEQVFQISNTGGTNVSNLRIPSPTTNITTDDAHFSPLSLSGLPDPIIIPPSGTPQNVTVRYTTDAIPASHSGNLVIGYQNFDPTANSLQIENKSVPLSGAGFSTDLMFVLDISGSMHYNPLGTDHHATSPNSRMDHVNSGLATFWPLLQSHAVGKGKMGLVVFPGEPYTGHPDPLSTTKLPLNTINAGYISAINGGIGGVVPHDHHGRGTPMTSGLETATTTLVGEPPSDKKVILLLTDGAHNIGTPDPDKLVDQPTDPIRANNIKIFAIGYGINGGDDVDLNLLDNQLVANTSGRFWAFDDTSWPVDPAGDTFPKFLRRILAEGLGLQVSIAPRDQISFGEVKEHKTYICEFDKKTSFICSWLTSNRNQLSFSIIGPDGTIVNSALARMSREISYYEGDTYKIYSIEPNFFASPGRIGEWVLKISANFVDSTMQEDYTYDVMMESGLKLDVSLNKNVYYTGDNIEFTARLTANGQGVDKANVFVEIRRPEEGAGNWHHQNPVDMATLDKEMPRESIPDPVSDVFRKGFYLINHLNISPPSKKISLPRIELKSVGNGLYKGKLSGEPDGTIKIGTYNFTIFAEGNTNSGNRFRREQLIQKYISAIPAPAKTELYVEYDRDLGDFTYYQVKVVPRDKFGNYLGPGILEDISLETTSGEFVGEVNDDLNGAYFQELIVSGNEATPIVRTKIAGFEMPPAYADVHPGALDRLQINFLNGVSLFEDDLGIKNGIIVGLGANYNVSNNLAVKAELEMIRTDDQLGVFGTVINTNAGVVVNLRNARTKDFVPYAISGAGLINFNDFTNSDESFAYNFGGGVKFRISRKVAGHAEVRNYVVSPNDLSDKTTHNQRIVWGVTVSF